MVEYFIQGAFLICVCQTWIDSMQNTSLESLEKGQTLKNSLWHWSYLWPLPSGSCNLGTYVLVL